MKRKNMKNLRFISIDGPTTKDVDDVVYIEKEYDKYRVYVAISDVSYFLEKGSDLDKSAFEKSTSTYYPHKTVNMLPNDLSEGELSLLEGIERKVFISEYLVNTSGEIDDYSFYEAEIVNHEQMTYDKAECDIKSKTGMVYDLYLASKRLGDKRAKEGAIQLERKELSIKVKLDDDAQISSPVESYTLEYRGTKMSETMIAELMIAANTCAADKIMEMDKDNVLLKVHQRISEDDFEDIVRLASDIGIKVSKIDILNGFDKFHGNWKIILEDLLMDKMKKAHYSSNVEKHFGVGAYYTHFTSPIRRYTDVIVHRLLKGEQKSISDDDVNHINEQMNQSRRNERSVREYFSHKYIVDNFGGVLKGKVIRVITRTFESNGQEKTVTDYVIRDKNGIEAYVRGSILGDKNITDYIVVKLSNLEYNEALSRSEVKLRWLNKKKKA